MDPANIQDNGKWGIFSASHKHNRTISEVNFLLWMHRLSTSIFLRFLSNEMQRLLEASIIDKTQATMRSVSSSDWFSIKDLGFTFFVQLPNMIILTQNWYVNTLNIPYKLWSGQCFVALLRMEVPFDGEMYVKLKQGVCNESLLSKKKKKVFVMNF